MDPKALAPSGSSDAGPVSSSNAHYSAAVPANARVQLIARLKPHIFHIRTKPRDDSFFSVVVRPKGTFPRFSFNFKNWATLEVQEMGSNPRKSLTVSVSFEAAGSEQDHKEITVRLEIKSTVVPVDSDYSSDDESVSRSKLE